ncbi:MAG TPA: nucleotidyltransferase family protein [Phycisphaerae bacterium]|nr:nucleotidyltransferase family protein [Phycisphaerae bacterium]
MKSAVSDSPTRSSTLARCLVGAHGPADDIRCESVDWPPLVRAACDVWLGGVLLEAIERRRWPVPLPQMQQLRWQARQIRQNNVRMSQRLARISRTLRDRGVDVLLLKGAALNLTVYDHPGLRAMADVDLMVRPEQVAHAQAVLRTLRFRKGRDQVRDDFFPKYYYELEYTAERPWPLRIDVHARLLRPLRYARTIPDDALWRDARLTDFEGGQVLIPSPGNMLIHLAAHAACHGARPLRWLYDIKRLLDVERTAIDWDIVVGRAGDWGLSLPVRVGLERTEQVFGPTAPPEAMTALGRARVTAADRLTLWHAPRDEKHPVGHVLVNLLCTPGLRFRAGYLGAMLLPGRRHMASVYRRRHAGWLACAHVYRWIRAIVRPLVPRTAC